MDQMPNGLALTDEPTFTYLPHRISTALHTFILMQFFSFTVKSRQKN